LTPKALGPLLGYLRGLGVAPRPVASVAGSVAEDLLERYRGYLLAERGLQVEVSRGYVELVRPFVAGCAGGGRRLDRLTAGEVSAFLVAGSGRLSPKTLQRLASALRSLLRFWHVEGLVGVSLAEAVPKVANRGAALPRALGPTQVQAMLSSCDRETAAGLRDLAILTLLARLGLRAGEVAGLQLDDIDWRLAEITVRGKGGRHDRLPLPADVGQAVADYLRRGRPATALDRGVFIRIKAPHRGLTSGGVTQAVAAAAQRAGLGVIYARRRAGRPLRRVQVPDPRSRRQVHRGLRRGVRGRRRARHQDASPNASRDCLFGKVDPQRTERVSGPLPLS
jgi:integrase/recombinase XerD